MNDKKKPDPIDIHVGARIRLRRNMLRLSQEKLSDKLGITFQQVQKYEKGINRVGAGRLQSLAEALNVQVSYFFEGLPSTKSLNGFQEPLSTAGDLSASPEGLQLLDAFSKISDVKVRRKLIDLAKALADPDSFEER